MEIDSRDIQVEFIPPNHWWESAKWKLLQPYVSQNGNVIVPDGFITDGATIFWGLRWLFSPTGKYFGAAIVHDYIIVSENDWHKANKEFENELKALNIAAWRRIPMVLAVKIWAHIRKFFS